MDDKGLHEIVDVALYPIDALETEKGRSLVEACRDALEERALCALAGFVRPGPLERMAREAASLTHLTCRYDRPRIAYSYDDGDWPQGHSRTLQHPCRYNQVLNHQVSNDSPIRRLCLSESLNEFLRRVLGYDSLYRSACPHLALTLQISAPGDCNGWHFDGNDAVFSLLLQQADTGGGFEYVPYLRSEEDENYEAVAEVFADPENRAQRPEILPGTFTLFKGDLSLHRVTTVGPGSRPRMIALFSYDRTPNMVYQQRYIDELRGVQPAV